MGDTLINGQPAEQVLISERALHYGDGLFETISCRAGRPRWLPLHLERLNRGCERLHLPFADAGALRQEIDTLAAGQERCLVKVIVSRGPATRRGYRPSGQEQPTRIVTRYDWPAAAARASSGFHVGVARSTLGVNPLLAGIKHLNRLEQVLAQVECEEMGVDEVLMLSATGHLISGSMSNVFFANESGLFTPALNACGVAGVMRRLVFEAAATLGTTVRVRPVLPAELDGVREAFVTNVRWGIQPVHVLNGRTLTRTDFANSLRGLIDAAHA